jgi:chromosome segregation ATPase
MQKGHRMGQLEELEQRITAAFSRISAGVVALSAAPAAGADDAATLQEERMANAQLTERLRALHEQGDGTAADLRAQVDSLTQALDAQGLDVQRLTGTVAQLREDLRRLREAAEQGIVDPALINRAMMAELEALRATRAAEANEMNDILSALGPILDAEEARAHA